MLAYLLYELLYGDHMAQRDQQMIALTRLVEDLEHDRVRDKHAAQTQIEQLASALDRPGNATYDPGAASLIKRANEALGRA